MNDRAPSVLGRFAVMIYGPTVLFSLGEGAIIPLLPTFAAERGADIAQAALVASFLVIGQLAGNLPAGWIVARSGERVAMLLAGLVAIAGTIGMLLSPDLATLAAAVFVIGACAAVYGLARHSFMTTRVPLGYRARALSLLGGSFRLGVFLGPFTAAGLLWATGSNASAVWFFVVCLVGVLALVAFGPDPERAGRTGVPAPRSAGVVADARAVADPSGSGSAADAPTPSPRRAGVFQTMWRFRGVLGRLGLAAASLSAVRAARQGLLPLWGLSIGMDAQSTALVVGVSGAIDFLLFYASGQVMDRFGRLWAALPAMVLMAAGFLGLALTHDLSGAAGWFVAFGVVLGVGNGLSSGILLTLGADVAPKEDPAPFLGSWRTLTDAGGALVPLLMSGIAAVASLAWASAAVGAIALLGALAFARWVPRFVPRARR